MVYNIQNYWGSGLCPSSGIKKLENILETASLQQALVASYYHIVPSSSILVTMMMGVIRSSEASVLTRATWHNVPEDDILHCCFLVF
jgi:hypothetical protein